MIVNEHLCMCKVYDPIYEMKYCNVQICGQIGQQPQNVVQYSKCALCLHYAKWGCMHKESEVQCLA